MKSEEEINKYPEEKEISLEIALAGCRRIGEKKGTGSKRSSEQAKIGWKASNCFARPGTRDLGPFRFVFAKSAASIRSSSELSTLSFRDSVSDHGPRDRQYTVRTDASVVNTRVKSVTSRRGGTPLVVSLRSTRGRTRLRTSFLRSDVIEGLF